MAERYVSTFQCCECLRLSVAKWQEANPGKLAKSNAQWLANNRERKAASNAKWCAEHAEHLATVKSKWRKENRERITEMAAKWRAANLAKRRAQQMQRKAGQFARTPQWADKTAIEMICRAALVAQATFAQSVHVDHVIPMRGRLVSGLHVPHNLQLLFAKDNCVKQNRFEVTV